MQYFSDEYLEHHGILGQKWGVRRFQNKDGSLTRAGKKRQAEASSNKMIADGKIPKGTKLYRVAVDKKDQTIANRKYFSLNKWDNAQWQDKYEEMRKQAGSDKKMYGTCYKATKDIKIANKGNITDVALNVVHKNRDKWIKACNDIKKEMGFQDMVFTLDQMATEFIAARHPLGNQIIRELQKQGFDALEDDLGRDVSYNPVILLDPDSTTKRTLYTSKH